MRSLNHCTGYNFCFHNLISRSDRGLIGKVTSAEFCTVLTDSLEDKRLKLNLMSQLRFGCIIVRQRSKRTLAALTQLPSLRRTIHCCTVPKLMLPWSVLRDATSCRYTDSPVLSTVHLDRTLVIFATSSQPARLGCLVHLCQEG